jgi:hypothetical protein
MGERRAHFDPRNPTHATPRAFRNQVLGSRVGAIRRGIREPDGWDDFVTRGPEHRVPEVVASDTKQPQHERQCEFARYHCASDPLRHGGHPRWRPDRLDRG